MRETYNEAIARVFEDEGGYSNHPRDPGGPTNWGITIIDARLYWKKNATASDVRNMPQSVAEDIYRKHYAIPVRYDDLPPGVDYAVLDYAINSGVSRALRVFGSINSKDSVTVINAIYDERLRFLRRLPTWSTFGAGWGRRCARGRALALALNKKWKGHIAPEHASAGALVAAGGVTASQYTEHALYIGIATLIAAVLIWTAVRLYRRR